MELRYLGFDQLENARVYRFGVNSRTPDDRQFSVKVDLGLFRTHGVAIQEGPSLCARKLIADLEGLQRESAHELTTADLLAFASERQAAEARRLEARKGGPRRSRPPMTSAQSQWCGSRGQEQQVPFQGFRRFSFSLHSIRQNAPHTSGVYGISSSEGWIFVGSGEDLQAALLNHLAAAGAALSSRMPTGFIFETCDTAACLQRQQRLIEELKPSCNLR
jgi:hypothetical protein